MSVFVLTGGVTGIGQAVKNQLLAAGHEVFVVDIQGGDFQADLTDPSQRTKAIEAIKAKYPQGIDGFIPSAGLGPSAKPFSLITRVNFFAAVEMTRALKGLLQKRKGSVVLVSSNSAPMPGLNQSYIDALLEDNEARACEIIDELDGHNAYAGSKYALTLWMRRSNTEWAADGIRMNAVAPGITKTPLTDRVMDDEQLGQVMKDFGATVPMGSIGEPEQVANVITFLLSEKASYVSGSVVFVDGGHDAMLRPDSF